jgi:hypothetical protein
MCDARIDERQNAADDGTDQVAFDHVGDPRQLHGVDVNDEIISPHATVRGLPCIGPDDG